MKNYIFLPLLFILFLISCVYSYSPKISKYEDILVVDGELTNLPGPYKVKLSRSFKYEDKTGDPVCGAQIKFIDNNGLEIELNEIKEGEYRTIDTTFQGVVGNSYKLQIVLDGEIYESDFETIKKPIPIDQVYWEYCYNDNNMEGIQIMTDAHDSTNSTHYYAWDYEETWKFRVPIDVMDHPEWKECYAHKKSTRYNIASSANRKSDIIERFPLIFINEETNRLFIRYTIWVKQYAFTETTYKFFKDLINLNQNQGSLFDPIPNSLIGNVKNLSDEDMPVLGYFMVAGASEKRIFIDRKELPEKYQPTNGYDFCNTHYVMVPKDIPNFRDNRIVDSLMNYGYTIYDMIEAIDENKILCYQLKMAQVPCYNCLTHGDNKVPEFWTEYDNN